MENYEKELEAKLIATATPTAEELEQLQGFDDEGDSKGYADFNSKINEAAKQRVLSELQAMKQESNSAVNHREALDKFKEETGVTLSEQVVTELIPPIYNKQLKGGKITIAQYLNAVKPFVTKEGVVVKPDSVATVDLTTVAGGGTPQEVTEVDVMTAYDSGAYKY